MKTTIGSDAEKAVFWIHNRKCRVLVFSFGGQVMDNDDSWNNLASAQCDIFHRYGYGITHEHVARSDEKRIAELNAIFDAILA